MRHYLKRTLLGGMILVLAWCALLQTSAAEVVDRVIAVVNDDIITLTELNTKIKPFEEKILAMGYPPVKERDMLAKVRSDMINQLIDQKLTDQEIKRYRIDVSEKEIDDGIERIKAMNYFTDEELRAALANEGITMEKYREGIKTQMLRANLVNYRIKSKIVITEEDIKKYYNDHLSDYQGETKYHLRNIIMKVSPYADDVEKAAVRNKAEQVFNKLASGEAFAAMAKMYSESSLAAQGGDLGLFRLEDVSPQLQKALKDLSAGEFTPVLDTDQGYQIFYIEEIVQSEGKTLEDVRKEIQDKLYNEIVNEKFQSWLEDLRKESYIKVLD
jgi:peptidyl-prolyl cis-trans isomerase SurA